MERQHRGLFHNGIYTGENIENKRIWYCRYLRKWVWVTIALCLTSNVVRRVRRINRTNKQTNSMLKYFDSVELFQVKLQSHAIVLDMSSKQCVRWKRSSAAVLGKKEFLITRTSTLTYITEFQLRVRYKSE